MPDEPQPPPPLTNSEDKQLQGAIDDDADAELKNIDGGPAQYKLVYFAGLRFRAEPIRLILRYADVPYEEELVSFGEWPKMKESMILNRAVQFDQQLLLFRHTYGRIAFAAYRQSRALSSQCNCEISS